MKIPKKQNKKIHVLNKVLILFAVLLAVTSLYMMHPQFGKRPSGERLERIKKSPQYRDGKFQNANSTPQLTENMSVVLREYFFNKTQDKKPKINIPSVQINWNTFAAHTQSLIWLGHSSYLIKIDGKIILVDPVLSKGASPIPIGAQAFAGTQVTTDQELPAIDYLFITHDHYDHMDYRTLKNIRTKVSKVICPLGVAEHLEHWGYTTQQIIEKDWWEEINLENNFRITLTPARHFSGRSIWHSNTLWTSYVLQTPTKTIYLGGDSGYDTHFKSIGEKFGPFDLAILENGQYDKGWKYIHMQPEEVIQASKDLKAKLLLPVHSSKFVLANHSWNEPLQRISDLSIKENIPILTPLIGEIVDWDNMKTQPTYWWKLTP